MKEYFKFLNEFSNRFFQSNLFCLFAFAAATAVVFTDRHTDGLVFFGLLITAILLLCSDIKATTLPFMLTATFLTQCYDSYDTFIKYAWLAVPVALALIFNFIVYRKPLKLSPSFFGILAVTVAVTLGGVGVISPGDYFSGAALYYVSALGAGMLFSYIILKSRYTDTAARTAFSSLARALYLTGLLVCLMIMSDYLPVFWKMFEKFEFPFQSNNYATLLMFALPFPFYYSIKNKLHLPVAFLMYGFFIILGSRGGMLFGTLEFLICLAAMLYCDKKYRILYSVLLGACLVLIAVYYNDILVYYDIKENELISSTEARVKLIKRAVNDFKSSPVFGKGLGYRGNTDVYNPVKGALPWYHMMIPQVVGSMGLVGIAAYLFQFIGRVRAWLKNITPVTVTLFLSYVGVLMMSQVNPGEFCPIPYELLAVMIFVIIENIYSDKRSDKIPPEKD